DVPARVNGGRVGQRPSIGAAEPDRGQSAAGVAPEDVALPVVVEVPHRLQLEGRAARARQQADSAERVGAPIDPELAVAVPSVDVADAVAVEVADGEDLPGLVEVQRGHGRWPDRGRRSAPPDHELAPQDGAPERVAAPIAVEVADALEPIARRLPV